MYLFDFEIVQLRKEERMIVKRVCFGSDCFRPFSGISGVIGSVAFATAALTAGGDGARS